jgi:ferredoxin-NADP reductase
LQDQVLATELDIGDEIALQPGPRTLEYNGEYLPVTDMVYFASGDGIVPVMDQVKSVLPPGSSSVKGVSVIWANSDETDFDIALSALEDEYFKYSTKLAVSCVVESDIKELKENEDVDEALPDFSPGTMAVISGPESFAIEATSVLLMKGYPKNCICVLPE